MKTRTCLGPLLSLSSSSCCLGPLLQLEDYVVHGNVKTRSLRSRYVWWASSWSCGISYTGYCKQKSSSGMDDITFPLGSHGLLEQNFLEPIDALKAALQSASAMLRIVRLSSTENVGSFLLHEQILEIIDLFCLGSLGRNRGPQPLCSFWGIRLLHSLLSLI